ncbi:MAG: hypothetical protein KTR27_14245 [Leptolyngbyaceae cyanobacterium MAG.088]|nr:hypothetical protein [Leptolyngbyaceae cyanobacterium MAG.088]
MMIAGGYLFLSSIKIVNNFSLGYSLYRMGGLNLTSGLVLVPFIFGVGLIFYNAKNLIGWLLATASLIMLVFGVIASIDFRLAPMSAFELMTILVLAVGGLGVFLSSLQDYK